MSTAFPKNPTDGLLFELSPGIVFQYNSGDGTWIRLQGYDKQVDLATPLRDGLMSKDDLIKINELLLPPPRTSLTADDCNYVFDKGIFGFRSSQNHLFINSDLSIVSKDAAGNVVEKKQVWKIHDNTYGINFRLNLPLLLSELEQRGKLVYHKTVGPRGKEGARGEQGINQLETGPRGSVGDDGKNASFPGTLTQESNTSLATEGTRGIVDIYTEEISPTENYLVAVRANIGNLDLCPAMVRPKKISSKWVVVTDERPVARIALPCNVTPAQKSTCLSSGPGCTPGSSSISSPNTALVQNFCSTRLYYVDVSAIEADILARFEDQLRQLKSVKEQLVLDWLKIMINVYNEQKLAICCAIENCESKRENTRHRQYIETQRITAAVGRLQTTVQGSGTQSGLVVDTLPGKDCPAPTQPSTGSGTESVCVAKLFVSCVDNAVTVANATSLELPAGKYTVEVYDCCCYSSSTLPESEYLLGLQDIKNIAPAAQKIFLSMRPYTGQLHLVYQGANGAVDMPTPDLGRFRTQSQAQKAYLKTTFEILHNGGEVKSYFAGGTAKTKDLGNSGKIELCFLSQDPPLTAVETRSLSRDIGDPVAAPVTGSGGTNPCVHPVLEMDLSCRLNTNNLNAVVGDLPEGQYVAELTDCCCSALIETGGVISGVTGVIAFAYNSVNGSTTLFNPDLGSYTDLNQALAVYLGNTFAFLHKGGEVKAWVMANNPGGNAGTMRLTIKKKECVDLPQPVPVPPDYNPPQVPSFNDCVMTLDQILFYEAGWKSQACCGVYVEAGGSLWLVVKRSVGTDISCGGGESYESDCVKKAHAFGLYPAIAYPTIDGRHFFGKPTSGSQLMIRDEMLEKEIQKQIFDKKIIYKVGEPVFDAILFPFEG